MLGDAALQVVQFTVWDTGIGIDPAQLNHLFQPFVQLDNRLARQYKGTGLGLALVNGMAQLHNGSVDASSYLGVGSRFTVTLPWRQAEVELAVAPGEAAIVQPLSAPTPGSLVQIAEDNESN